MRKFVLLAFAMLIFPITIVAQTISLSPGDTKKISFKNKIDTVFISDQSIASYKILSDKSLLFYGLNGGTTTVNVLGEDDKSLMDATILVTDLENIVDTNKQLKIQLPKSNLHVTRVGQAYILEGQAKDQEELETAQRILALATGNSISDTSRTIGSNSLGQDLFKTYEYDNVVNNAQLVRANQINVRLTVVEVDRSITQGLGINWTTPKVGVGSSGVTGDWTSGLAGFGGVLGTGVVKLGFTAGNLKAFVQALDNREHGKVLAEPNLSMLSGEISKVLIGGEIPLMKTTSDTSTVEYKPYGISLEVGAKLQPNGRIRVAMSQRVSDILPQYVAGLPVISTTESESMFEVANGESFIIGGLYSKRHSESIAKVPFLGDLPVLGAFFRDVSNGDQEKELIIVATVNLVKPVDGRDINYPNFEETGVMENYFNLRPVKNIYNKTQVPNFFKRGGFIQ